MPPLKDGLPRKAYAYAPTAEPSTWKIPYLTASGKPDPDRLPAAAAALSSGGFRGQKADIPSDSVAMVKSKLRAAYRKWKGSDVEYPDSIKESTFQEAAADGEGLTIREATLLLDRAPVEAKVIFQPNGDTLVVPCWDGQFQYARQPLPEPDTEPKVDYSAKYDAQDAADILQKLYRLKGGETDEPDQMAMIDGAIAGILKFLKAEGDEIGQPEPADAAEAAIDAAIDVLREAGRRNSTADQKRIQSAHDLMHDLGAQHESGRNYPGMMAEAAPVLAGSPEDIRFRESAGDGAAVVTLAEANPLFNAEERTVTITPIRPGWGNARDNFFYPSDTLKEATDGGLFNHIKMYRDHPRKSDEKELPERSVKDWFATTREARWDPVRNEPRLEIKVHDDDVFRRFQEAPEQIAFSILGHGTARKGAVGGRDGKIVESFHHVRSVDWVTEAGAGGAIAFAESAAEEHDQMDIENLTAEQLKEANPKLYAELVGMREHDGEHGKSAEAPGHNKTEADASTEIPKWDPGTPKPPSDPVVPPPADAPATDGGTTATEPATSTEEPASGEQPAAEPSTSQEAGTVTRAEFEALRRQLEAPAIREAAKAAIADELGKTTLPKKAKDVIAESFAEAGWGNGYVYTDEPSLRRAVAGQAAMAAQLLAGGRPSKVTGMGADAEDEGSSMGVRESVAKRIETRWGTERMPKARDSETGEPVAESNGATSVADRMAAKF